MDEWMIIAITMAIIVISLLIGFVIREIVSKRISISKKADYWINVILFLPFVIPMILRWTSGFDIPDLERNIMATAGLAFGWVISRIRDEKRNRDKN